ncbi:hypothetical protein GCM10009817_06560 [Terrabacter lapilli]|uniref:4Fe-4S Wbl-type domain-containing protein n=1 Tax=Terrabacter lapilli TaxID=436231 RepID=A0ABP5CWQ2_9MICO
MSAHEALARALEDAADAGLRIPCAGSDDWISEDPNTRTQAARRCDGCPCITECAAAADETRERFGVWAGRDRSPQPPKTKKDTAA